MTDQEIIKGLIDRDNQVTQNFFFVKCRPLFYSVMRSVFDYEVEYDEMVNELYIYLSEDAGANKPSPQFFDYALQRSGAQRESTQMIGDNLQTDIMGAMSAGLDALFFNRYPEYEKTKAPTFIVTSLRDIMNIL